MDIQDTFDRIIYSINKLAGVIESVAQKLGAPTALPNSTPLTAESFIAFLKEGQNNKLITEFMFAETDRLLPLLKSIVGEMADDLAERAAEKLDYDEVAREAASRRSFEAAVEGAVGDALDYDDIAERVSHNLDIEDKVKQVVQELSFTVTVE